MNFQSIVKITNEILEQWEKTKKTANEIADYLEKKLPSNFIRDSGKKAIDGWVINFLQKNSKYDTKTFYTIVVDTNEKIRLIFSQEKDSSLIKTIKNKFDTKEKAIKAIEKFFIKS